MIEASYVPILRHHIPRPQLAMESDKRQRPNEGAATIELHVTSETLGGRESGVGGEGEGGGREREWGATSVGGGDVMTNIILPLATRRKM